MINNNSLICVSNNDQSVDLLCEVLNVEGVVLYCDVINGRWPIQFDLETGQCFGSSVSHLKAGQYQIRHILPAMGGHYNYIMNTVDKLIQSGLDYSVKTNIESSFVNVPDRYNWDDTIPF
jgi:hypothetical protein